MHEPKISTGARRWKSTFVAFSVALGIAILGMPAASAEAANCPKPSRIRSDPNPSRTLKKTKYKHWKRLCKLSEIPGRALNPNMLKQLEGMLHIRLSSFFLSDGQTDKKFYSAYYTTPRGYTYKMRVNSDGEVVQHVLVKRPTSKHPPEPPPTV